MMEEPASNIVYNTLKLQRSQVFQMRFDTPDDLSYYSIPRPDFSVSKISTPTFEYSEWRTFPSGTEDGFSDDTSESIDMESHSPDFATFMAGLSPSPCMPRKPSTERIPKSIMLSDRRAQCRLSFGLPSDNECEDPKDEDLKDECSVASDEHLLDGKTELFQTIFEEQQQEILHGHERIERMTKSIQKQSKRAREMMETIHHRDEEINKMQTAMDRFRRLLKLKDNDIENLLKIIQESC